MLKELTIKVKICTKRKKYCGKNCKFLDIEYCNLFQKDLKYDFGEGKKRNDMALFSLSRMY